MATWTRRLGLPSGGLWSHQDFLKLWTGQTISEFGSAISQLAIPILAAVSLHASPLEFSLLEVLGFLPFILFALPAGVWVDRLRRRRLMDRRRRLARGAARADPDPLGDGRAADVAAPRPAVRDRRLHRSLRRRVSVVPPGADRATAPGRREREAAADRERRAGRRPQPRLRSDRGLDRAVRDPRRRRQLRRLERVHGEDAPPRGPADARRVPAATEDVAAGAGRAPLGLRPPLAALDRGLHGQLELLLERPLRDRDPLHGAAAAPVGSGDRLSSSASPARGRSSGRSRPAG